MSEIFERVGQAIHAALTAADFEASHMTGVQLNAAARAAIEAMRDPTQEMIKAVDDHPNFYGYGDDGHDWIYQTMIDAALATEPVS